MKKRILSILAIVSFGTTVNAQIVNIPDANFKAYLLAASAINTNSDAEIQVSEAIAFTGLMFCNNLGITDLTGLSSFTSMDGISFTGNSVTSFNLPLSATWVNCSNNPGIMGVDLSLHSNLNWFDGSNCNLNSLNVANGNNSAFVLYNSTNNPNLNCIQVDDVAYSTANWTNVDPGSSFSLSCSGCIVNVPDINFKAYLVGNSAINTNLDTEIQCAEASSFTGTIICSGLGITDMTGIEEFTNLDKLFCSNNSLTNLDVSNNTVLTEISCNNNFITSLNVSNLSSLWSLVCNGNSLTNLDVSTNTALTDFYCFSNSLTNLDLFNNTALTLLNCTDNSFANLDVSNNIALATFYCTYNSLTSLDVTNNTSLIEFDCGNNFLTSLDVSNNITLTVLFCNENSLVTLDLSNNAALTVLSCYNNTLTFLNAANGNNPSISLFYAPGNPNLACIQVDDAAYSTANWTDIDPTASFSENCCSIDLSVTESANTITATLSGATYQWVDCDNGNAPINGETNQSFTPTSNGNYACIIDDGNCSDMSACTSITTIGINELSATIINIHPNPASDQITIGSVEMIEEITIFNMFGELVQQETSVTFSVENLSNGVYIMNIKTKGGIVRSRLIKE